MITNFNRQLYTKDYLQEQQQRMLTFVKAARSDLAAAISRSWSCGMSKHNNEQMCSIHSRE